MFLPLYNNHIICDKKIDNSFISEISKFNDLELTDFEKLKMGLPISYETLEYIDEVAKEKVKTISLFEDIRQFTK